MTANDWERWRDDWAPGAATGAVARDATAAASAARARLDSERRRMRTAAALEGTLVVVAVAGIAAAVLHAPEPASVAWGAVVASAIVVFVAVERLRRRDVSAESLADPTASFVALATARGRRQLRAIHVGWVVIALSLAFLAPWWADGFRAHGGELSSVVAIVAWWIPAALIVTVLAWTIRMRRRVAAELARLAALHDDDDD